MDHRSFCKLLKELAERMEKTLEQDYQTILQSIVYISMKYRLDVSKIKNPGPKNRSKTESTFSAFFPVSVCGHFVLLVSRLG